MEIFLPCLVRTCGLCQSKDCGIDTHGDKKDKKDRKVEHPCFLDDEDVINIMNILLFIINSFWGVKFIELFSGDEEKQAKRKDKKNGSKKEVKEGSHVSILSSTYSQEDDWQTRRHDSSNSLTLHHGPHVRGWEATDFRGESTWKNKWPLAQNFFENL